MKIQFWGAARTTTGSQYVLEVNNQRILLECGLYQGKRAESIERNSNFPFDPKSLSCAVLSHAHLDHCGNFPSLYKKGFRGNIYSTSATRDLAALMLEDSAHIQMSDTEYLNRKRAKQGLAPIQPLYGPEDIPPLISQFVTLGYHRELPIADGVVLHFRDAGHILGSAQVILDIREGGRQSRYLFTGDIGRGKDLILKDPEPVENVDFLQIESTYGTREHDDKSEAAAHALDVVLSTLRAGGKVVVPAFSVGRTQQFVYSLHRLFREKKLPAVPMFVDSPLSTNATEIHRLHPECFNEEIYKFFREVANPFEMNHLTYIRSTEQSRALNDLKGPMIIISASGMAEGGRIVHHLRNTLSDPRNTVLFIGYCAADTLGAKIRSGQPSVNIFGEPVEVRAKVVGVDSYSGHADRSELLDYTGRLSGNPKSIFVVHGEEESAVGFGEELGRRFTGSKVLVPRRGDSVDL